MAAQASPVERLFAALQQERRVVEGRTRGEHAALMRRRAERIALHHLREPRNGGWRRLARQSGVFADTFHFGEWSSVPIIDKAFLCACAYAERPAVAARVLIVETSGSTSSAVAVPHTPRSVRRGLGLNFLRALMFGGVGPHHRHWGIEHQLSPAHLSGSHLSFDWLRNAMPGQMLVTGTSEPIEKHIHAARQWRPDCISSAPGFLVRLAMALEDPLAIHPQFVLYGGAALERAAKRTIARALAPERFIAFYPTTDAGALGVSPADDGVYRCFSETHLIEVVGAAGRHVSAGEEGDLIVTALDNPAAPLIRYRVGDRVRYLGTEANRVLVSEIARRAEAALGASLLPFAELAAWTPRLQQIEPSVAAVQLVRRRDGSGREQPIIRVAAAADSHRLQHAALALLAGFPQVRHEIASGELLPPEVDVIPPEIALAGHWKLPAYVDETSGLPPQRRLSG